MDICNQGQSTHEFALSTYASVDEEADEEESEWGGRKWPFVVIYQHKRRVTINIEKQNANNYSENAVLNDELQNPMVSEKNDARTVSV